MTAHHAAAHHALGVLHRNASLRAFDKHDEGHDGDHQHNQENDGQRGKRAPCLRLGLFVQVEDAARQAHYDANENDERHAVADAAVADLLTQPHDEGGTGGQRENGHQHERRGPDDKRATGQPGTATAKRVAIVVDCTMLRTIVK